MISDYTVLALGTRVEGGEIKVCPKCNQRGLHVEMDGHHFYTHSQTLRNDDPKCAFIRRIECHLSARESDTQARSRALPLYASPST